MALKLKVSNIACEGCTEIITESIQVMECESMMDVDVKVKTVMVESAVSDELIKQVIVAASNTVEGY